MNRILLLVLSLLIGLTAPCQSKKERKKYKIHSTTEWETATIDGKQATYKTSYEEYDRSGRSTLKAEYAPDGTLTYKATAVFDKTGNKIEETEFDASKKKNTRITSKYNVLNDKTEEIEYSGSGEVVKKTVFSYDANGNRISETETDGTGTVVKKIVNTYNAKNLKTGRNTISSGKQKEKSKKWDYVYY